jgi:methylated-DNA-[protein]-cysteine S-methyltransferase
MPPIVKSGRVSVERRSYTIPGWGEGELWFGDGLVLANGFRFSTAEPVVSTAEALISTAEPPMGAGSPPLGTVPGRTSQLGDGSVTKLHQRRDDDRRPTAEDVIDRVRAFLDGEAVELADLPLDLSSATAFQRAVTDALRKVPRGDTVTYGELAALAGRPNAQRAAGTVCARNEFMFLVPCHRVVSAGGIGGYGSAGLAVKRRLLALEGVVL